LKSLTGRWDGSQVLSQRGGCSLSGGGAARTYVSWNVSIGDDGSLSAAIFVESSKKPSERWMGSIDPSLNVTLVATRKAQCDNHARDYTVKFVGKIIQRNG